MCFKPLLSSKSLCRIFYLTYSYNLTINLTTSTILNQYISTNYKLFLNSQKFSNESKKKIYGCKCNKHSNYLCILLGYKILEQFLQYSAVKTVMQKDQKTVESGSREFLKKETGKKRKIKAPKKQCKIATTAD